MRRPSTATRAAVAGSGSWASTSTVISSCTLSVPNSAEYGLMPQFDCVRVAVPVTWPSFALRLKLAGRVVPTSSSSPLTWRWSPCAAMSVERNAIGVPFRTSSLIVWAIPRFSSSPSEVSPPVPSMTCIELESADSSIAAGVLSSPTSSVALQSVTRISRSWPALAIAPPFFVRTESVPLSGPSVYRPAESVMPDTLSEKETHG